MALCVTRASLLLLTPWVTVTVLSTVLYSPGTEPERNTVITLRLGLSPVTTYTDLFTSITIVALGSF